MEFIYIPPPSAFPPDAVLPVTTLLLSVSASLVNIPPPSLSFGPLPEAFPPVITTPSMVTCCRVRLLLSFILNTRELPCAFIVTRLFSSPSIVRFLLMISSLLLKLMVFPAIVSAKMIVSPALDKLIASRSELPVP